MLRPAVPPNRGGSNGLAPYSESYTYNATTGNLASKAGVSYTYGDPDHVHAVTSAGTKTYKYDDNGNQVTRNIGSDNFTLIYDAENRLVEVQKNGLTIASFTYDGDGKRVKSVNGSETTLFVGGHYEVVNGSASKYYFAGAQRVAVRKNGALSFLIEDHLGSTSIATDGSGNKISEIRYKAWGEVRYASGAWVTDYTYTGQYSNVDDFGLMFYGARWYDPSLSRWAQPDQIVPEASQGTQAWDRFAYVNNSPINYSDPTGQMMDSGCGFEGWTGGSVTKGVGLTANSPFRNHADTGLSETFSNPQYFQTIVPPQLQSPGCISELPCISAWTQPKWWDTNPKNPDYFVMVINIGPVGGGSLLIIYDRYGNIYVAPSFQIGKSWEGGDIQISGGWVGSPFDSTMPDPANLTQFLSGLSFSAGGGIVGAAM